MRQKIKENKAVISKILEEKEGLSKWEDWNWQEKNLIKDINTFEKLLEIKFSDKERIKLEETIQKFPLSITPYYLSLIDRENFKKDPIFLQSFPNVRELKISKHDMKDPLLEEKDSPVKGLTHRYPDRVLLNVSGVCAMYCRHCTRKRKVGDKDCLPTKKDLSLAIKYIEETPNIRDVLLSGGDPFMLSDSYIDWILNEIFKISHVEVVRIGTRVPVVLPYRITNKLVKVLKKYKPLWINTHFNHPREITKASKIAIEKLVEAGIPVGNQSVLLLGVNDCPRIMKKLCQKLVQNRIRPYYLYQCDLSEGLSHFRTPVGKGIEILESMIGHTSGFAVPTYVIDAPGGGGKVRLMPNYLLSWSTNKVILRNYEGVISSYKEPDHYINNFCDRNCETCSLSLNLDPAKEYNTIGIEKLLSDHNDAISLVPRGNERRERRKKNVR